MPRRYYTSSNIPFGTGISINNDLKGTAFTPDLFASVKTPVKSAARSEYEFKIIADKSTYKNSKTSNFGISIPINIATELNLSTNETINKEETLIIAYSILTTEETYIDLEKSIPNLNETALDKLTESEKEFQNMYGDGFVTGKVKGCALVIAFRLITKNENDKNHLDAKLSNTDPNVLKDLIKSNLNKSNTNSYSFTDCRSRRFGLIESDNKHDIASLLNEMENLKATRNKECEWVFEYTLNEYRAIPQYHEVKNTRPPWRILMEMYNDLETKTKLNEIQLYNDIMSLKEGHNLEKELKLKVRLSDLLQNVSPASLLEEFASYIISGAAERADKKAIEKAIEKADLYGTPQFSSKLVSVVFERCEQECVDRIIEFSKRLSKPLQETLLASLFDYMDRNSKQELFRMARKIKDTFTDDFSFSDSFPDIIKKIIFDSKVCIRDKSSQAYLLIHKSRALKRVSVSNLNLFNYDKVKWEIITDNGKSFLIRNLLTDEYLELEPNGHVCMSNIDNTKWNFELSKKDINVVCIHNDEKNYLQIDESELKVTKNNKKCTEFTIESLIDDKAYCRSILSLKILFCISIISAFFYILYSKPSCLLELLN